MAPVAASALACPTLGNAMKERHAVVTEALGPSVWTKLHVQLSAGQIRRDMAALLPPTGHEGESAEGAYIVVRVLERAQRTPPLQESMWELPPLGSHGHPPPASQRRALRWPLPTGAAAAPATSADRPHRSGRALRRPSRYAGEEELEAMEPCEDEEMEEEEEGSLAGRAPAAELAAIAAPGASSGAPASGAASPLRGLHRLPSRQAESHAYMTVQDLHDMEEGAVPAVPPAPGRSPLMVGEYAGGSPYAHVAVQQAPPWLASQPAGLARSSALPPAGFTAAAGAALPFMQQAQHKLAGPAARALCSPQHAKAAQQELEHWMEQQRHRWRQGTLSDERRRRLEGLGVHFHAPHELSWEQHFAELLAFKEELGHADVPARWPPNPALAAWVEAQRRRWRGTQGAPLTAPQHSRLLSCGFQFELQQRGDEAWEARYTQLLQLQQQRGGSLGDKRVPAAGGLRQWATAQRQLWRQGALPPERASRLAALGLLRGARERWLDQLAELDGLVACLGLPAVHALLLLAPSPAAAAGMAEAAVRAAHGDGDAAPGSGSAVHGGSAASSRGAQGSGPTAGALEDLTGPRTVGAHPAAAAARWWFRHLRASAVPAKSVEALQARGLGSLLLLRNAVQK
ncbi:DEAD DEAH box helicase [Chlorella sorokiniana]|uniref:DEAD DEAH box helicase n=1 Tax=Chlorella sorokiniana TaxID=3076 RepID=A0A2P6U0W9_CHLSO|nr:DEAD DEAH box helicase [Chlorella sorokiniana]|eukprot:PRW59961.1 DEAD DEAH box helicase [Chlorella sorokiniana]